MAIGRPFQKGQSGNPSGRAKGLERRVRDLLGDNVDAMIYVQECIAFGIPPEVEQLEQLGIALSERQRDVLKDFPKIAPRDATKAFEALADRGWGRPRQKVELDGHVQVGTQDLTKMTREQLEDWVAAAERANEDDKDDDGSADAAESPPQG